MDSVSSCFLSWGGLHRRAKQFEFLSLFSRHSKKGTTSRVFYHNSLFLISIILGQGGAKLAKNIQKHVYIDVLHEGNMLAARGGYPRVRPCRHCHGNESHESQTPPLQQKVADSLARTKWKLCDFFRFQKWFSLRSTHCFSVRKIFRTFFTVLQKGFLAHFHDLSDIF